MNLFVAGESPSTGTRVYYLRAIKKTMRLFLLLERFQKTPTRSSQGRRQILRVIKTLFVHSKVCVYRKGRLQAYRYEEGPFYFITLTGTEKFPSALECSMHM